MNKNSLALEVLAKIVRKSYLRDGKHEDCHVHPDLIEEARQVLAMPDRPAKRYLPSRHPSRNPQS